MTYIKQLFILSTGKHTHTHNSQLRVVFYSGTLLRTTAWEGSLSDSSGELFQKVREEPGYTGVSTEKQTNKKKNAVLDYREIKSVNPKGNQP